ncbi:MAG: arylesterase [Verrucomicrobia bacterium]|nr:arylesterase [Verrucomicrobiota bacterium]
MKRRTFAGALAGFITTAWSTPDAPPAKRTVLVLGDSLAAGYGLDPAQAFPALLQRRADAAGLAFEVINAGVSGDTTAGGLRRLDWLLRREIHVLLIELGGNDGLRGIQPATTRANLEKMIEKAKGKYPKIRIVLAGMQMPPNMGDAFTEAFRVIYPELAAKHRVDLVPFLLEGVGGVPELNQPDRIHPTAEGQEILAGNIWKVLEGVLRKDSQI